MGEKEPAGAEQKAEKGMGQEDTEQMTIQEYHEEFPNCAVCGSPDTCTHHIDSKGMGGSKVRDQKNNWIPLCNHDHMRAHRLKKPYLTRTKLFELKAKMEKKRKEEYVFGGVN